MWRLSNNRLIKDVGELQYQITYKEGLEGLDGIWSAWRMESSLVAIQVEESSKLEKCIKGCNQDSLEKCIKE